jgi:hypothetical protein
MKLTIQHVTQYDYSAPVRYALQSLCLTPQASAHQTVHDWTLSAPAPLFAQRDGYGNMAHTWSLAQRAYANAVRAGGTVETHASPWLVDDAAPPQLYLRVTPLTAADDRLRADTGGRAAGLLLVTVLLPTFFAWVAERSGTRLVLAALLLTLTPALVGHPLAPTLALPVAVASVLGLTWVQRQSLRFARWLAARS